LDNDRQIRSTATENAFPLTHLARDVPSKRVIVMRNRGAYDFPFGSLGTKFVTDRGQRSKMVFSECPLSKLDTGDLGRQPQRRPAAGSGRSDRGARWVGAPFARVWVIKVPNASAGPPLARA